MAAISEIVDEWIMEQKEANEKLLHLEDWNMGLSQASAMLWRAMVNFGAGWLPVDKYPPEERINKVTNDYAVYPCIYQNGDVKDIRYYSYGDGHWRHGFEIMDQYVTHWMDIYKLPDGVELSSV